MASFRSFYAITLIELSYAIYTNYGIKIALFKVLIF
jgi:hypothetical protein